MIVAVNFIANFVTMVSVTFFIIGVFGRKSKVIESLPIYQYYLLKTALSTLAAGSFLNMLTLYSHHASEVVLNVGVALIFSWAAWFHWSYFIRKKQ